MRELLFLFVSLLLFYSCEIPQNKQYSKVEKDSIIQAKIKDFREKYHKELEQSENKFQKLISLLDSIKTSETYTELKVKDKIPLKFPVCGGYSDSCRFISENMTMLMIDKVLKGEDNPFSGKNLTPYEIVTHFRNLQKIQNKTYIATRFKNSPFSYILKNLANDFYNLQMFWNAKYFLVLEVKNYEAPVSEFGGGNIRALWHFFDFKEDVKYKFSVEIEAKNTKNFSPPSTRDKQVTRTERQDKYLPNGRRITENKTVTETETEYLDDKTKYYYAEKNLYDNFKKVSMDVLNEFFTNERGERVYIF